MHTQKSNRISGIERVQALHTELTTTETVFFAHQELITLLKKRFYYLESQLTVARDGKRVALESKLNELSHYVKNAKNWVDTQEQVETNFESMQFDVLLICANASRLLQIIHRFDQVMTKLAAAQFAGGQVDNIRKNHFIRFSILYNQLFEIACKSEPHFHSNGTLRESSNNLRLN